jgi:hypothetical protein
LNALQDVVAQSQYKTLVQAVASLAVFSHPETVKQTEGKHLFSVIRARGDFKRGHYSDVIGGRVFHDDNWSPTQAFAWANDVGLWSKNDVQYNHIVSKSDDFRFYTSLTNLVALPSFLSKLTDTHKEISSLLRFRSQQLYGAIVADDFDQRPALYDELVWADTLPAVGDVQTTMRHRMSSCPKNRTVLCARNLGWYFSGYKPDNSLGCQRTHRIDIDSDADGRPDL